MTIFDYDPPTIWTCDMYGRVFPLKEGAFFGTERASDQVAMADTEQVENRPKCDYRVTTKKDNVETTERCKSEKDLFEVKGRSKTMGRPLKTDICGKHLTDVWGKWRIESAEKRLNKP